MAEESVGKARGCSRCGAAATWRLANGGEEIPFCWGCDERGAVDPIRAAWRRYNAAENSIRAAFDEDDQPTREELLERDLAKAGIADAIRAEALREREAEVERLREALRRYMTYAETFGYERLSEEFGPAEFPESSESMEAWIDRVLREPARAALGERLWGLPVASEDVEPPQIKYSRDAIIRGADDD